MTRARKPPPRGQEACARHAAEARLVGVEDVVVFGMTSMNKHLHLEIDGRPVTVQRAFVADYARPLLHDGATLPVAVDPKNPDKITIDWETAAEREAAARGA